MRVFSFLICQLRSLYVIMSVYVFVIISDCQSKSCLSILFHFSINQASYTAGPLQGKHISKQQLTERRLSKRQNEITTHSCAGPFCCFSIVWGLSWKNQYLSSPVLVWLFVIQWRSTEVNGAKQASACLACLCSVDSLIHHSVNVYRLEVQHFPETEIISLVGLNRARRHF